MWPHTLSCCWESLKSKGLLSIYLEVLFKWFYKQFDYILLGSESFKEFAHKRVDLNKTLYFPNWADLTFECQKPIEKTYRLNKKAIISYAGNIGEAQGLECLVEAVKLSKTRNYEIRLIGDGRAKESLKYFISTEGLNNQIKFYDPVDSKNLYDLFNESDFLFLSLKNSILFSKTVPAKFQTYLASGVPIIGLISGETNKLIREKKLGYCCNAANITALSEVFDKIKYLEDFEYQKMKANCINLYKKNFSSTLRKKDFLSLLNKLSI